jgi:hypothetical protein
MYEDYNVMWNPAGGWSCPNLATLRSEFIQLYHPALDTTVAYTDTGDYWTLSGTFLGDCFSTNYSVVTPAFRGPTNSWAFVP